jgi:hypothetical protein
MRSKTRRRGIIVATLALAAIAAGVAVVVRAHDTRTPEYLCWDAPITGPPAKYQVTFDGATPLETMRDCLRLPQSLPDGQHTVVLRAVDAFGQVSPPATLTFVLP